jgi:alkanesulfonate monooxygenase SsuD/methylene tetrahydromethanopterin reductase-like flavin-dependent oxidoreductase (luciferase family)
MEALRSQSREISQLLNKQSSIVVGSPEHCIEKLKVYEALGADRMLCLMQLRGIPHKKVMRSIELFGKEVLPAFHSSSS